MPCLAITPWLTDGSYRAQVYPISKADFLGLLSAHYTKLLIAACLLSLVQVHGRLAPSAMSTLPPFSMSTLPHEHF